MKRIFLALTLVVLGCSPLLAQSYKMTITKTDGTVEELLVSDIADITFASQGEEEQPTLPDQNADQIIIKELYNGGCPKDQGTEFFQADKCIILYNNCPQQAVVNNLCFGFATPYNSESNSNTNIYDASGHLVYESEGFIPALNGIWYYPHSLVIEPWSQVVINVQGAIDNTLTYSQSINYANPDCYCMYDPESGYSNTSYYPTPSSLIPTSHYLRAVKYGQANSWPLSVTSPALFIFQTKDITPMEYGTDVNNLWYAPNEAHDAIHACLKIPNEWIIDAIEVFNAAKEDNKKRLTADIDAGYVYLTNKLGHSLYRNVDQEMTEALPENAGKLVYTSVSLSPTRAAVAGDPSGIDAEASIRNGAHIVYLDTNYSTDDFHERSACSLRYTTPTTR